MEPLPAPLALSDAAMPVAAANPVIPAVLIMSRLRIRLSFDSSGLLIKLPFDSVGFLIGLCGWDTMIILTELRSIKVC